ncbi:hypothetical protein ACMFMG_004768 [Clarireedia jacksonii]
MAQNNATAAGPPAQQAAIPAVNPANNPTPQGDRDGDVDMNQEDVDSDSDDDEPRELRLQETLKVALPDKYSGNRKELDTFLLQLGMYFRNQVNKERDYCEGTVRNSKKTAISYTREPEEAFTKLLPLPRRCFCVVQGNVEEESTPSRNSLCKFGPLEQELVEQQPQETIT